VVGWVEKVRHRTEECVRETEKECVSETGREGGREGRTDEMRRREGGTHAREGWIVLVCVCAGPLSSGRGGSSIGCGKDSHHC